MRQIVFSLRRIPVSPRIPVLARILSLNEGPETDETDRNAKSLAPAHARTRAHTKTQFDPSHPSQKRKRAPTSLQTRGFQLRRIPAPIRLRSVSSVSHPSQEQEETDEMQGQGCEERASAAARPTAAQSNSDAARPGSPTADQPTRVCSGFTRDGRRPARRLRWWACGPRASWARTALSREGCTWWWRFRSYVVSIEGAARGAAPSLRSEDVRRPPGNRGAFFMVERVRRR